MGKEGETVTVLAALPASASPSAATTKAKMEEHDDDDHVAIATGMLICLGSRGKSRLPITKDRRRKYGKRSDDDVNSKTAAAAKAEGAEDSNSTAADKRPGSNITEAKDIIQEEDGGPKETSRTGSRSNNNRLLPPPANPTAVLPCLPQSHSHHHHYHHKPNYSFKSPTAQFDHLERAPKIPLSTKPSGHAAASHPAAVPSPPAKVVATASAPTSTVYCNLRDGRSCTVKRGAIFYGNVAEAAATASQARKRAKTLKERAAMTAAEAKATAADFMAAVTAYTASVAAGGPDGAQRPASSSSRRTLPPPEEEASASAAPTTLASTVSDSSMESATTLHHTSEVAKAELARLKRRRLNESYGRAVDPIMEMRAAAAMAQQVSAPGGAASISRTVSPPHALLPPLAVPQVHCVVPMLPPQQENKKRERGEGSSSSKQLAQHIGDASTCAVICPNDILVHPPSSDPSDRAAAKAAFHRVANRRFRMMVEWNLGMYFNPALVPSHRANRVRQRTVTELVKSLGTSVLPARFLRRRRRRIGGCSSEQDGEQDGAGGREVGGGKEEGDGSYEVMSKDSVLEYVHETFLRAGKVLGYVTNANAAATAAAPPATATASLMSSLTSSLAESSAATASSPVVEDVPVEASALAHPQPCARTATMLQGLHVRQQQQQHHQRPPPPALPAGHRSASDEGKEEEDDDVAVAAAALLSQQRSHPPPLESCNSGEVFLPGRRSVRFAVKDEAWAGTGAAEASVSASSSSANKSSLRGVGIGVGVGRRRDDNLRVAAQAQMQLQVHERALHSSHPHSEVHPQMHAQVRGQAQPHTNPQAAPQADNRVGALSSAAAREIEKACAAAELATKSAATTVTEMSTKRLLTEHLTKIQSIEMVRAAVVAAATRQAVVAKEGGEQALAQVQAHNQCHAAFATSPAESTMAVTVAGAPAVPPAPPAAPAATRMPIVPRRNDVLVVRGAIPPNHVGNRRFRILLECNLCSYIRAANSSSSSAPSNDGATKEECDANATAAAQKGADKRRRLEVIERMVRAIRSCSRGYGVRFLQMPGSMWTEMRAADIASIVDRTFRECAESYRDGRTGGWTALTLDACYDADDVREGRSVMGASVAATTTVARLPSVAAASCAASASPAGATTAAAQEDGEKAPRPNGNESARNPERPPTEESAIVNSTSLDQQSDSCSFKSYRSTTLPVFPPNVERLQRDAQQRLLRNHTTLVREHEMKVTLGPSSFAATTAAAAVAPRSAPSKEEQKLAEEEVSHPSTATAEKKAADAVPEHEKFDQLLIRISDKKRELQAALQEKRLTSEAAFGALNVTAPATAVPLAAVPLAGVAAGAGEAVAAPLAASPVQVGMDEIRAHARQLMQQQMSPKEAASTMVGPHQQESSKPVAEGSGAADLVVPGAAATAVAVALEKQISTEQLGINELKAQAKELLHQWELLWMRQFQQRQVLEGALLKARQHAQLQLHAAQHAELELCKHVRHMCKIAAVDSAYPGSRAFPPPMSSLVLAMQQAKALQQAAEGPPDGQLLWKAPASPRKGAQINGGALPDEIPSALSSTDGSSEFSANKSVSFREAAWGQSGSHRVPARRVSFQAEDESPSPGVGVMTEDDRKHASSSASSLLMAASTASSSAPDEGQQPCHIIQRGDDRQGLFTKKVDPVNITRTGVKDQYDDCNEDGEIQVPGRLQLLCAPAEKSGRSLQGNDLLDVIRGMMMMKNQSKRDLTAK